MTSNPSFPSPLEDVSPATSSDAQAGEYTVGVDLGQSFDPTAVAVVRKLYASSGKPLFQVGHLERLPLQMPYPRQVDHVAQLMARLRGPCELVCDATGVGKAIVDLFAVRGLAPIGVTITAGDVVTSEGLNFHVPKLNIVSRLQALLHNGQLKIHKHLADAPTLVEELGSFQAAVTNAGYWRFGARGSKHDDLVLAVGLACWRSAGDTCFAGWGTYEFYRQQYGDGAVDREPTALPAPQVEQPTVTLQPPTLISAANGLSGRLYTPDPRNGYFTMIKEDAAVMIAHGWQKVEPLPRG